MECGRRNVSQIGKGGKGMRNQSEKRPHTVWSVYKAINRRSRDVSGSKDDG